MTSLKIYLKSSILIAFLALITAASSPSIAASSAVVLIYHRFGEDKYPSTNIKLEQFKSHIEELHRGGYQFLPLIEITRRIKQNIPLPERTVAITVDDAYKSFADHAWPLLKKYNIPATLFVSTDPVDRGRQGYLSWPEIKRLRDEGVAIGHHGAAHIHMPQAGFEASVEDIKRASKRFSDELGEIPQLFAYPYGEYSSELMTLVKDLGFAGAFAQYSSPVGPSSSIYALPRFALNENYGNLERFKLVANTVGLPAYDILPKNPVLTDAANPPYFGFSVEPGLNLNGLSCYPSHLGKQADLVFAAKNRIEIRFDEPFPKGRNRINCTMPSSNGRFYWLGAFFLVPE